MLAYIVGDKWVNISFSLMIFYSKLGEGSDTEWEARKNDAEIRYCSTAIAVRARNTPSRINSDDKTARRLLTTRAQRWMSY